MTECARLGVRILGPDVNTSASNFSRALGERSIRFGLSTIKNVGEGVAERDHRCA